MSKFYGAIGYSVTEEIRPGVWGEIRIVLSLARWHLCRQADSIGITRKTT